MHFCTMNFYYQSPKARVDKLVIRVKFISMEIWTVHLERLCQHLLFTLEYFHIVAASLGVNPL